MVMCLADKCLPVDQLHKLALKLDQTEKPTSYKMGKLSSEIFTVLFIKNDIKILFTYDCKRRRINYNQST